MAGVEEEKIKMVVAEEEERSGIFWLLARDRYGFLFCLFFAYETDRRSYDFNDHEDMKHAGLLFFFPLPFSLLNSNIIK